MEPVHVVLNENDFRALVSGKTVETVAVGDHKGQPVKIILSDIGWGQMQTAIFDAIGNAG